jgi:hypothetical protein
MGGLGCCSRWVCLSGEVTTAPNAQPVAPATTAASTGGAEEARAWIAAWRAEQASGGQSGPPAAASAPAEAVRIRLSVCLSVCRPSACLPTISHSICPSVRLIPPHACFARPPIPRGRRRIWDPTSRPDACACVVLFGTHNRPFGPYLTAMNRILISDDLRSHSCRAAVRVDTPRCTSCWSQCTGNALPRCQLPCIVTRCAVLRVAMKVVLCTLHRLLAARARPQRGSGSATGESRIWKGACRRASRR